MTNKQKEKYLSCLMLEQSNAFLEEKIKIRKIKKLTPKILFKYRKFDQFTFEMLSEPYVYLSPVGGLDDPFDCLTNMDPEKRIKKDGTLALKEIDFIIRTVCKYGKTRFNPKLRQVVQKSYVDGIIDKEIAMNSIKEIRDLSSEQKQLFLNVLTNIQDMAEDIMSADDMKKIAQSIVDVEEVFGVCSFSTKRDNKVMWSLYSNEYKGYCVEYAIPDIDEIRFNLCPVLYKRNDDNDFIHNIIKLAIASCVRFASRGIYDEGLGSLNELFCTKDTDWSFQDEWRLIGMAEDHIDLLKIKAVYLGFKTSKHNVSRVVNLAQKKEFNVFLMKKPSGKKKISYIKLV